MASLTGVKELDKALKELADSKIKKVTRSAVGKSLRVLAKGIKKKVPPKFKGLKKAIGSRFSKAKGGIARGQVQAKVGIGVGMPRFRKVKGQWVRNKKYSSGKHSSRGVGISAQNAHWFILGTKDRIQKETRKSTGRMPPQVVNLVQDGVAASESAAMSVLLNGLRAGIQREANRK